MKKRILSLLLTGILLCGCGAATLPEASTATDVGLPETTQNTQPALSTETAEEDGTTATVQGPYGSVSLTVPEGWSYTICNVDDDNLLSAEYAIQFSPEKEAGGYIEVGYHSSFGVCGTGLEEVDTTLAGASAQIGYYEGSNVWDYIYFGGANKGIVALASENEKWEQKDLDEVLTILNTLVYRADEQSGAIGFYESDSELEKLGLMVSAKHVSKTGVTLIFQQFDSSVQTELSFGKNMTVEKKMKSGWKEADIVADGKAGYNDAAHIINLDGTTEYQYDWKWLYGELDAGEYRISVPVTNRQSSGDDDSEVIYAHFLVR
jgi:hypothetical protein